MIVCVRERMSLLRYVRIEFYESTKSTPAFFFFKFYFDMEVSDAGSQLLSCNIDFRKV